LVKAHSNLIWPLVLVSVPVHIIALGPWWQKMAEQRMETTSNPLHISLTRGETTLPRAPSATTKPPSPAPVRKKPVSKPVAATPVTVARSHNKIPLSAERGHYSTASHQDNPAATVTRNASIKPDRPLTLAQKPVETGLLTNQTRDDDALKEQIRAQLNYRIRFHRVYPRLAIRNAWQGQVDLGIHILANGRLVHIRILRSSGHSILDKAAMQSLQRVAVLPEAEDWLQGRDFDVILPVIYRLQDS